MNQEAQSFLESRVEAVKFIYHKLTNRDISIEFRSDPVYHQIGA